MKSYIFKIAHQQTKRIIKSGDNYQVTFGAVLKMLHQQVRTITKRLAPVIEQGFTKLTVERRLWTNKAGDKTGGYCLTLSSASRECNVTRLLNESSKTTAYYMTHDAKVKTINAGLAIAVINHLTK